MEPDIRGKAELDHIIPPFMLININGEEISPWDYKGKMGLFILFFNPRNGSDLETLSALSRRYDEIKSANAEVLAIAEGPHDELQVCAEDMNWPFQLLSDEDGHVRSIYGANGLSMFVADRFGELRMHSQIEMNTDDKINAALTVMELTEIECPECGAPTWKP